MRTPSRNSIDIFVALSGFLWSACVLGFLSFSAYGQDSQTHAILMEIRETADDFCETVPLEHTEEGDKLNVQAKAKVSGLLGKVVGGEVGGGAEYHSGNESRAVLEKDIVAAIQAHDNCKLHVFDVLEKDLIRNRQPNTQTSSPQHSVGSGGGTRNVTNNSASGPDEHAPATPAPSDLSQIVWLGKKAIPKWVIKYEYLRYDLHDPSGGNPYFIASARPDSVSAVGRDASAREDRLMDDFKALIDEDVHRMFIFDVGPHSEVWEYYLLAYGYPTKADAEKDIPRFTALADKLDRASLNTGDIEVLDLEKLCPSHHLFDTQDMGRTHCKENSL